MKPTLLSPSETLVDEPTYNVSLSPLRKYVLLGIFCLAQFLDSVNNSSLFSAIPSLVISLGMSESESTWLISAFQLTFASFLLVSGRISDIYNPKHAFITGVAGLGVISVGAGFCNSQIGIIVLRAVSGIAASLTIPSALTLLVAVFPDAGEQARAIGVYGGMGAVGNVLGLVIGAIFVEYASWHWIFWFVAIVTVPIGLGCFILVPPQSSNSSELETGSGATKFKKLDIIGVSILTAALILFIFAVTSASMAGWTSAKVLAPLIISIVMVIGFFYWETLLPREIAAIPPHTWFYPNFGVIFCSALLPYFWWTNVFNMFTTLWQDVYHWSAISTAIHMFPIGVMAMIISFTGSLSDVINPKWLILTGQCLMIVATILLHFVTGPHSYWPIVFPAFALGSTGAMFAFTHTNIAIFRATPSSMAGTVGAIFNGALQLGSAVGIAACSSIETSVEKTDGGFYEYHGRAAAFLFVLGVVSVEAIAMLLFHKTRVPRPPSPPTDAKMEGPDFNTSIPALEKALATSTKSLNEKNIDVQCKPVDV